MKMKGGLIGLVMIVFALTFIGPGDVGATNCYNLYYNETCVNYDWENWDHINIALHRDQKWEGPWASFSHLVAGTWSVFGNSIHLNTVLYSTGAPDFFNEFPVLAGVKTGIAKLIDGDPYHSKANISKAQGFFKYIEGQVGCWYLKKTQIGGCPWISEGQ